MLNLTLLSALQIFMDSTFYGCFVILSSISLMLLKKRYEQLRPNEKATVEENEALLMQRREVRFWIILGSVMLVLTTLHWAFAWGTMMSGLDDTSTRAKMSFMRLFFEMVNILVGDFLVLKRLWTIGSKRRSVVAVPSLCLLGFLICAIRLFVLQAKHLLHLRPSEKDATKWFLVTTIFTACLNLYSTIFIAWKAWSVNKTPPQHSWGYFMYIVSILIESVALYTAWMIMLIFFVIFNPTLWSFFLPVAPSLYGCAMTLVSVRLGLGWALGQDGRSTHSSTMLQFAHSNEVTSRYSDFEMSLEVQDRSR